MKFVKLQVQVGVECVSIKALPGLKIVVLSPFPGSGMCCSGSVVLRGNKRFFSFFDG